MQQPIKRTAHGAIDYGFAAVNLLGPVLLGLGRGSRAVGAALAIGQGGLNAVTDQPLGMMAAVPFRMHGTLEGIVLPLSTLAAWRAGAFAEPRSRAYFAGLYAALAVNYALTDYGAEPGS